ncbi:MAG: ABC transporter substrate-binding protein [Rhodospirillaceae bacterium]|nr:ABC transporter substrate-binding protein [Rhodospirillaceae bacterium]
MSGGGTLDLICFPGAPNLPIFAALQRGLFTAAGVEVRLQTTPSSTYQIEQLARGAFQIAGTAFDNVVAYREGQGAVAFDDPPDLVALMGATRIELAFVVAPDIRTFDDLRGRSIALDALATGFAFVLYDMLERAGLPIDACELVAVGATPQRWESVKSGAHAGTLTIEPFTSIAVANGFGVLSSSRQTVPDYQGGVFAASGAWVRQHAGLVGAFIRGYLAGLQWTLAPGNYPAAKAVLLANMPAIRPGVADTVMAKLLDPATGLTPGGELDLAGAATVLRLRSRYARPARALADPAPYLDLSHWRTVTGRA